MTENRSARFARSRRKDRERQQKRRDKLKQSGTPTTHTLDRALSHGLMVAVVVEREKGHGFTEISVRLSLVLSEATERLTAGTHANNRYDREKVIKALVKRLIKHTPDLGEA